VGISSRRQSFEYHVVSGRSICIDLQGIADRAVPAGNPVIVLLFSS